jgi:hypothetical protein
MAELILASLTPYAGVVRIHDSGDFYSQDHFDSWCEVARRRPWTRLYGYSKSLPFWVAQLGDVPANLVLTASRGGRYDHLIDKHQLRYAQAVFSEREAEELGLAIDHDDALAMDVVSGAKGLPRVVRPGHALLNFQLTQLGVPLELL